jgi:hypothetical protein
MKIKFTFLALVFAYTANSQVLLNESFGGASFPPEGWSLQSVGAGDYTWYDVPNTPAFGAIITEDNTINQNERLITPTLDLSSQTSVFLAFQTRMYQQGMITDNRCHFFVKISTDNGINWTTLWDETQFNFNNFFVNTQTITLDISNYTGVGMNQIKVMFQYTSIIHNSIPDNSLVQLYNVNIATCPRPVYVTQDSAITWSMPSNFNGTVDIEYGPVDFTQSSGTMVTGITGTTYTLPNMNCQSYDYFIRGNCGSSTSAWTNRISRRLLSSVSANSADINPTTALINWTVWANNFVLEYGPTNFLTGTGTTVTDLTGNSQLLSNLTPCTGYTVRVKASCDTSNTWAVYNFTTKSENMINPIVVPSFTETFDNTSTLCSIGYTTSNVSNTIENNTLKVVFNQNVTSRKITLTAGNQCNISIDARINLSLPNTIGVIQLLKENDNSFSQNLFTITNTTQNFSNFSTSFTPTVSGNYFIRFRFASNSANNTMFYDNLMVSQVLSNIEFNNLKTTFSPNPTTSQITFSQEITNLEIFDIAGKKVKTFESTNITFDVSALEEGIYLLKGKTNDGIIINEKLIKN